MALLYMTSLSLNRSSFSVSEQELKQLTDSARTTSWKEALSRAYEMDQPAVYQSAAAACLTSWMPLLPIQPDGVVLSFDASLGATTEGLAHNYSRVVHMNLGLTHLAFSRTRLYQEGLPNVEYLLGDPLKLPIRDDGVAAVVGIHLFPQLGHCTKGTSFSLKQMEQTLCKELSRVLRPGGTALLGIMNKPSPWLPREVQTVGSKATHRYYSRLFQEAGFGTAAFHCVLPDLASPRTLLPVGDRSTQRSLLGERFSGVKTFKERVLLGAATVATHLGLLSGLSNSYLILAKKRPSRG